MLDSFENLALSGNRTPVSRVAGENSTTEPTMLIYPGKPCKSISDMLETVVTIATIRMIVAML